jgi:hypothetical protein
VKAKDEANRAVAYWTQRVAEESAPWGGAAAPEPAANPESAAKPESAANPGLVADPGFAQSQLALARGLEDKFGRATAEIDARAEALRAFFNRCEVKLGTLESRRRDHEESERLARLSSEADVEIARARNSLEMIGHEFLNEALAVASAIGGLQRLQLLDAAGRVGIDQLETVADRIVEASASDREAIDELERSLTGGGAA